MASGKNDSILHRMVWNAGNAKLTLDGKPYGEEFKGFDYWGRAFATLGPMELTAGNHELGIEVTGKDEKSLGYVIGVDAVWLTAAK